MPAGAAVLLACRDRFAGVHGALSPDSTTAPCHVQVNSHRQHGVRSPAEDAATIELACLLSPSIRRACHASCSGRRRGSRAFVSASRCEVGEYCQRRSESRLDRAFEAMLMDMTARCSTNAVRARRRQHELPHLRQFAFAISVSLGASALNASQFAVPREDGLHGSPSRDCSSMDYAISHPEHLHHLVAEVVDHLHRDPARSSGRGNGREVSR